MTSMPNSDQKFKVYGLHKSFGITILGLVAVRVLWRTINTLPVFPAHMDKLEKFTAKFAHAILYVLMFYMPLSGWLMSSAAGFPVVYFGTATLPNLVDPDKALMQIFRKAHELGALCFIFILIGHIAAALLHHFWYKDTILTRMLPWSRHRFGK